MKRHGRGRLARSLMPVAAALIATLIASPAPVTAEGLEPTLEARIRNHVSAELERLSVPGAAVAVVNHDGAVFAEGFGSGGPDGVPVTAATPFQIASVSKLITAVAVMQLVQDGRLRLNDPISSYIAWFGADEPRLAEITVRDLLAHTSGFSRRDGLANWTDDADEAAALERNARRLAQTPPSRPIGQFEYSNANYDLLGHVIEVVSGQTYDAYLADHVFGPLGMDNSYVSAAAAREAGLAGGHYPLMGIPVPLEIPFVRGSAPSAFLMSSADDLGQLLSALLNGGRLEGEQVLGPASVAVMQRPLVATGSASAYAMGMRIEPLVHLGTLRERRASAIEYDVPVSLQHGGDHVTYAAHVLLLPRQGWGVAVVMNLNDATAPAPFHELADDIAAILLGHAPRPRGGWSIPLVEHAKPALVVLIGIQVWVLIGTLRSYRRWRREPASRPALPRALVSTALTLALGAAAAAGVVWLAVERADAPWALAPRMMPDIAAGLSAIVLMGLGWGPLRTILLLRAAAAGRKQAV